MKLRGNEHWAYVQTEAGVYEPRRIKLGYEGSKEVLIVEGVQAGELIVKDNGLLLAREFRIAQENALKPAEPK